MNLNDKGKTAIEKLCKGKTVKVRPCGDFSRQKTLPEVDCSKFYIKALTDQEAKTDPDKTTEKKVVEEFCERKVLGTQTITVFNDPRKAANQLAQCWMQEHHERAHYVRQGPPFPATSCHDVTQFEHYLTLIDSVRKAFTSNAYRERKTLSDEFNMDLSQHLKDIGRLDAKKYEIEFRKPSPADKNSSTTESHPKGDKKGEGDNKGVYELFSSDDDKNIVLCFNRSSALSGVAAERGDDAREICTKPVVTKPIVNPNKQDDIDYPTAPAQESLWSSGQCADTKAFSQIIVNANGERVDLDYCTILKRFTCYARGATELLSKGLTSGPLAALKQTQFTWSEPVSAPVSASAANASAICGTWPDDAFTVQFTVRSPVEMIRFVGDLLYYQAIMQGPDLYHNVPLTLGWDTTPPDSNTVALHPTSDIDAEGINGRADCHPLDGGCVFVVHPGSGEARVEVTYRNQSYFIAQQSPTDHTLEVMSIIHQLVDLNKSATDLRTTPTVEVVP